MRESVEDLKKQLEVVNEAINADLVGGQYYAIGSRHLRRVPLSQLMTMKSNILHQIQIAETGDGLYPGVHRAILSGTR